MTWDGQGSRYASLCAKKGARMRGATLFPIALPVVALVLVRLCATMNDGTAASGQQHHLLACQSSTISATPKPSPRHQMMLRTAGLVCAHITKQLAQAAEHGAFSRPLIVGVQGPQGSGKTTITTAVQEMLQKQGLTSAVFSLDDIYLPHEGLVRIAKEHPENKLLQGRGQPGTHDVALGTRLLQELKGAAPGTTIHLPMFDKSAYNGQGDRSAETNDVVAPIDVVIFEGWCLGFYPLESEELARQYKRATEQIADQGMQHRSFFTQHSLASLQQVNNALKAFLSWYKHFDAFVQLHPNDAHYVFDWRLQTEHKMKAKGKDGMSDEQVHDFVARYMPGYELFGEGVTRRDAPWAGKGIRIDLDKGRNIMAQSEF